MHRFWDAVIAPLLEDLQPKVLVEVGSFQGHNTRKLLEFCQRTGAVLHAIDPLPRFSVRELEERHGEHLVMHECLSLEALEEIPHVDAAMIDGDHNWYTVFHELRALEKAAAASDHVFPVCFLHDVGWPYGRRDQYYSLDTIPAEYRKPSGKGGLLPGRTGLLPDEGLNAIHDHALAEGDERNGVLTAVEDFMAGSCLELGYLQVPGFHDMGVLHAAGTRDRVPFLARLHEELGNVLLEGGFVARLEEERVGRLIDMYDAQRKGKLLRRAGLKVRKAWQKLLGD